jgi:hypothetical protein
MNTAGSNVKVLEGFYQIEPSIAGMYQEQDSLVLKKDKFAEASVVDCKHLHGDRGSLIRYGCRQIKSGNLGRTPHCIPGRCHAGPTAKRQKRLEKKAVSKDSLGSREAQEFLLRLGHATAS